MPTISKPARAAPRPTGLVRGLYVLLAATVLLESAFSTDIYPDDDARREAQHKLDFKLLGDKAKLRVRARRDTYTLKR